MTEVIDRTPADRTGWGSGPWDSEPDRVEFVHVGLPCLLHRGPSGHWCGYAAVPPGHPLHGKDYDDVDVRVHGGLTYADKCDGTHICHVPAPGESGDVWWFGFDCAHSGDLSPRYRADGYSRPHSVYRDVTYVRAETERLAEQLVKGVRP